jgi:D-alanyl-lipoteichoic acid acyltransferase DltB (MBOAT superfamily)
MMNQLGYQVPECYPHPLLATSPKQFWSRWNTYIGSWVRLYVFQPLFLYMWRRTAPSPGPAVRHAVRGAAIVVSFACIGFLHDAYNIAKHGAMSLHAPFLHVTLWFSANGLVLVVWEIIVSLFAGAGSRWALRARKVTAHVLVIATTLVFAGAL